jgi:hypothetical protein
LRWVPLEAGKFSKYGNRALIAANIHGIWMVNIHGINKTPTASTILLKLNPNPQIPCSILDTLFQSLLLQNIIVLNKNDHLFDSAIWVEFSHRGLSWFHATSSEVMKVKNLLPKGLTHMVGKLVLSVEA